MTTKTTVLIQVPTEIALREHESFYSVVRSFVGVCSRTGAPLVEVRLAWDDSVIGEDSYDRRRRDKYGWTHQCKRHADGTACYGWLGAEDKMDPSCDSQSQCPECHQYNTLDFIQEAYGNRTICRNPNGKGLGKPCTYNHYYSIGD